MKIGKIILLLLITKTLSAQTFQGNNQYIIVLEKDSANYHYLQKGNSLITNANLIPEAKAYMVDTTKVLDSIARYIAQLPKLPTTGELQKGEIYEYQGEVCRVVETHIASIDPKGTELIVFKDKNCPEWKKPIDEKMGYKMGDCVTYKEIEWTSLMDKNIEEPGVKGWKEVSTENISVNEIKPK